MRTAVTQTSLAGYPVRRGKVRDIYDLGDRLLLISTDRISAFDWVLPTPIPDKGRVLTQVSRFWFDRLPTSHHVLATDLDGIDLPPGTDRESLAGRSMVVRKCAVVPIECVVRGYLDGSGWKEYQQSGTVCGIRLAARAAAVCRSWPSRSSRRPPRRRPGTTSISRSSGWWRSWARRRPRSCGGGASRSTSAARTTPASRASDRRHQVRMGPLRRPADPDRRSHDAGQLAVLAGRPVPAGPQPAVVTTSSSSATI